MSTITHINSDPAFDLKDRRTPHGHYIAHDLGAEIITELHEKAVVALLPETNHIIQITTYDATDFDHGFNMVLKYKLINPTTRDTKFDIRPIDSTAEATEILREVISRAG